MVTIVFVIVEQLAREHMHLNCIFTVRYSEETIYFLRSDKFNFDC